jgi:hypothetical protein
MENSINYNQLMEKQIENIIKVCGEKSKPRLLLHCCCAPCSSACLERLNEYFDITAYFYNPNITDYTEYIKRYDELVRFLDEVYVDREDVHVYMEAHDSESFLHMARGLENEPEKGSRCRKCYELRMRQTAIYALENGYDYFTTTLSISPHKNAKWINSIGIMLEEEYGITFLYSDFKKKNGYKRSIELSGEHNLYRQNFCGCEYSRR